MTTAEVAAQIVGDQLDRLLRFAQSDTNAVFAEDDVHLAAAYFDKLRDTYRVLAVKLTALEKHVEMLSRELLPTLFSNHNEKSVYVQGVGQVTINDRWSASMVRKDDAFVWLRNTGNEGLIIETVNAQTLGAFAKTEALEGRPLPSEIFKVSATPYVSITKA